MRVPVKWLSEFVRLDMPVEEVGRLLTMSGLKVESIDRIGESWTDVVVAEVLDLEPHPSSNKPLNVTRISTGEVETTVVTGAQNVSKGDRVALVPVGGVLPFGPDGQPLVIAAKPMAGITSRGMLASERELGISDEHSGILILPRDAPVGSPLREVLGEDVLDIETNPNRPDTLSVIGIAREVAAVTRQPLLLPSTGDLPGTVEWVDQESVAVTVEAPHLCTRYSALRIEGVRVEESPSWLKSRLEAAGMRPINLLVDLTNYVMLECGQPMHAFDASSIRGQRIVVREAVEREHLRTLDGVERSLSPANLVIADGEGPIAVAGVMGGEETEITPTTTTVVLESANFEGIQVRRTAQSLGLRTESSSRFEKSLPAEQTVIGIQRYLPLLAHILGTPVRVARLTDVWSGEVPVKRVRMPLGDVKRLLGIEVSTGRISEILTLLGFEVEVGDDSITATVPFWRRVDIDGSADLVEEIGRIVGFDQVPSPLPQRTMDATPQLPALHWDAVIRERLLAAGVNEATTHSLTSEAAMRRLVHSREAGSEPDQWRRIVVNPSGVEENRARVEPVEIINPSTQDRRVLRLTLLPMLLEVVARNLKHVDERVSFFEIDHTFFKRSDDLPYERRTLCLVLTGARMPRSWQDSKPSGFTFYDLKGVVEALLEVLLIRDWTVEARAHPALHPGRSAVVTYEGQEIAYLGELHPSVASQYDVEGWPVQVAEIDLDVAYAAASDKRLFQALPRYPSIRRDIAIVVDGTITAERVLETVRANGANLLKMANIFDVYEGQPLPEGKKSIAVTMEFRSPDATLTQERASDAMEEIVSALKTELRASLRD